MPRIYSQSRWLGPNGKAEPRAACEIGKAETTQSRALALGYWIALRFMFAEET